jgi:hypothetical protein
MFRLHLRSKLTGSGLRIIADGSIIQITLFLMELSTTLILVAVITTIRRYSIVWTCMTATGTITTALFAVHQVWKTRGLQSRDLLTLLVELDDGRFLDTAIRDQVNVDIAAFTHVSQFDALKIFTYVFFRRCIHTPNNLKMFQQRFQRYCYLPMTSNQKHLRFLLIVCGTNIALRITGRGKFGTMLLLASGKFL